MPRTDDTLTQVATLCDFLADYPTLNVPVELFSDTRHGEELGAVWTAWTLTPVLF